MLRNLILSAIRHMRDHIDAAHDHNVEANILDEIMCIIIQHNKKDYIHFVPKKYFGYIGVIRNHFAFIEQLFSLHLRCTINFFLKQSCKDKV